MNKYILNAPIGAGSTDGRADSAKTSGGGELVTYGPATSAVVEPEVNTQGAALPRSRTVVTRASNGSLTLRYSPKETPTERLPTS
jgi:hypothetical protein